MVGAAFTGMSIDQRRGRMLGSVRGKMVLLSSGVSAVWLNILQGELSLAVAVKPYPPFDRQNA